MQETKYCMQNQGPINAKKKGYKHCKIDQNWHGRKNHAMPTKKQLKQAVGLRTARRQSMRRAENARKRQTRAATTHHSISDASPLKRQTPSVQSSEPETSRVLKRAQGAANTERRAGDATRCDVHARAHKHTHTHTHTHPSLFHLTTLTQPR